MCDRSSSRREPPLTSPCRAGIVVPALPVVGIIAGSKRLPVRRDPRGWLSSKGGPLAVHHRVPRKTLVQKPRHGRLVERCNPLHEIARSTARSTQCTGLAPRSNTPAVATPFPEHSPVGHGGDTLFTPNETVCKRIHRCVIIDDGDSVPY